MFRFKISHLLLFPLLGLIPVNSLVAESHYCIAVDGGFGHGGTTFIGTGFAVPGEGNCTPWAGFTKTASSVISTTSGTGCLSSDGKVLTVSVLNADPSFFGSGQTRADYIRLTRSSTSVGFGTGQDTGYFSGSANVVTCTSTLLHLPETRD
jgi:hypothetical protein